MNYRNDIWKKSEIIKKFSRDKQYTEKEVNEIIKLIYEYYAIIRRDLLSMALYAEVMTVLVTGLSNSKSYKKYSD